MSSQEGAVPPLLSRSMNAVIVAQFFSAFGDNALLFATLALIKSLLYPEWSQPVLQMGFVAAYIVLAPFVGKVADSFAKERVMMFANALKLLGVLSICVGAIHSLAMRWSAPGRRHTRRPNTAFLAK